MKENIENTIGSSNGQREKEKSSSIIVAGGSARKEGGGGGGGVSKSNFPERAIISNLRWAINIDGNRKWAAAAAGVPALLIRLPFRLGKRALRFGD